MEKLFAEEIESQPKTLLKTIKLPKNLNLLQDRLPVANYLESDDELDQSTTLSAQKQNSRQRKKLKGQTNVEGKLPSLKSAKQIYASSLPPQKKKKPGQRDPSQKLPSSRRKGDSRSVEGTPINQDDLPEVDEATAVEN